MTVFYAIKINATATDVEIGGIRYTVYDNSKYAIAWNVIDGYEGDFEILDSVSYEGKMYPVTEMPQTIFYNIKIDNLYVRCHPKSYNFLSFVSKSAIIYVHGSELEKVKQYSEKNINTIEKFWISQKTEQLGAVSFELTQTPYCGNVELVSVMANNETLQAVDGKYVVKDLMPGTKYEICLNWKIQQEADCEYGVDKEYVCTATPLINVRAVAVGYKDIKFKIEASSDETMSPTEISCNIRGLYGGDGEGIEERHFNFDNIKADENGMVYLNDLVPCTYLYIEPFAVYKNKRYEGSARNLDTRDPNIKIDYEATQTTLTIKNITAEADPISFQLLRYKNDQEYEIYPFTGENITLKNLLPDKSYYFYVRAFYDNGHYSQSYIWLKTLPITPSIEMSNGATSIHIIGKENVGNATLMRSYFEGYENQGNELVFTGLKPETPHEFTFVVETKEGGINKTTTSFSLDKLSFETLAPKVVGNNSVIVCAKSNIADDETNAGFEWRKFDAPDMIQSKQGYGIVYDGMLEGRINNLSNDSYYKARPFYKDNDGTYYYGEWIGFDPSDFSFFEPTVHTYATYNAEATSATLRGSVLQGTDDIKEQGFEYWAEGNAQQSATRAIDGTNKVIATGQNMSVTISDLTAAKTYCFRTYAQTDKNIFYGETQKFTTPSVNAIEAISANGNGNLAIKLRGDRNVEFSVDGTASEKCRFIVVSLCGQVITNGQVTADGSWHAICDNNIDPGLYILNVMGRNGNASRKFVVK